MFSFVRRKIAAARTLATLCDAAEREARHDGQAEPGAEHFVLAALSLPDGRAARAFERLGATDAQLREAIAHQYHKPLQALGIDVSLPSEPLAETGKDSLYRARLSGQLLIRALARDRSIALTSDRVLLAATEQSHGVFPRALAVMGLSPAQLRSAATQSELRSEELSRAL